MSIKGEQKAISRIFNDDYVFSIPEFQRPYSWTSEHANELFDDLLEASKSKPERDVDQQPPYFLGSIVLIKKDDRPDSQVVDGQQRLTTLLLLYSALRATIEDKPTRTSLDPFLKAEGNVVLGTKDRPRLLPRPDSQKFFEDYIVKAGGMAELNGLDSRKLKSVSEKNLRDNAIELLARSESITESERQRLAAFVSRHAVIVVVSSPDLDSAFRIFRVLNDRGMNLSAADIIKADVIGKADPGDRQRLAMRWEQTENDLGAEAFEDLFAQIRMIYRKQMISNLLVEFRESILPSYTASGFLDDVLEPYADYYSQLVNCSSELTSRQIEVDAILRQLSLIDNSDWMANALFSLKHYGANSEEVLIYLQKLERLAASQMIRRVGRVARVKRYSDALKAAEKSHAEAILSMDLSVDEKRETIAALSGDLYNVRNTPRYVLSKLESCLHEGEATYNLAKVTVEHVLPQNPPPTSEWTKLFSDEDREELTHQIGNLLLLSRRKNSKAGNWDFEKKKSSYFTAKSGSPFACTSQVLAEGEWTPSVIRSRTLEAVNILKGTWDL